MSLLSGQKTYIGIAIAALPTLLGFIGYSVSVEGAAELGGIAGTLLDNLEAVVVTAGALFAAYGRRVTK